MFLLLVSVLLPACSAGADLTEFGNPTLTPDLAAPTPTVPPTAVATPAASEQIPYVIERVVLATEVDGRGAPVEEASVIAEEEQSIILTVQMRGMQDGTRFKAVWFEGENVIGQSDQLVEQVNGDLQWVPLPFRSIAKLNPAASHRVELVVNDRRINSYVFRVGVGDPSDIIADSTLALGTNSDGEPVKPGKVFDPYAPQVVLIVRVSNMVDPTGMIFTTSWLRDGLPLGQSAPDGGQPQLVGEPPEQTGRRMTFTFIPVGPLIPGDYTVKLLMNAGEIARYPFKITDKPLATPTPTEQDRSTPTPEIAEASLRDIGIAEVVIEDTGEPTGQRVSVWEADPGEDVPLYVVLELADLRIEDEIEFTINVDGRVVDRHELPAAAFEQGWLTTRIEFDAPNESPDSVEYEIIAYINGDAVGDTSLLIESLLDGGN